ncbi:MAG: hypothetical protein N2047_04210 [Meiothermus sp.]|nr:hypothetical protein [Meiothermus sp.]
MLTQTQDLNSLDLSELHRLLGQVYQLPEAERKEARARLQAAYTRQMQTHLAQFTGSARFFRMGAPFQQFVHTEGVQFLAQQAGCYWLLDLIASYRPRYRGETLLVARLTAQDSVGRFTLSVDERILARQKIAFTDFPMSEIELWVARNEEGGYTILLPSEH